MGTNKQIAQQLALDLLIREGAFVEKDHFVLAAGRHSDTYVNKRVINHKPQAGHTVCQLMSSAWRLQGGDPYDVVVGPADGAITLSQWLAYWAGEDTGRTILSTFASKIKIYREGQAKPEEKFEFNSADLELITGHRILLVEDILTSGGSLKKVADLIEAHGGNVVGACAIWNRNQVTASNVGAPMLNSLIDLHLPSWEPKDCPLCKDKVPINTKLGKGKDFLAALQVSP